MLRDNQRKKDRRTKVFLQGGVIVVVLAIVAVVAFAIVTTIKPASPGPRNMLSDGILIGEGFTATRTAALEAGETPVANERDEDSDTIRIQMFVDYFCPICGEFEKANGDQLSTWVESGAAEVEIFPMAILDRLSNGTKYATRAANAAACVADNSPDSYYDYNTILFENQPEEGTDGLTDAELIDLTVEAGVSSPKLVANCIEDQEFKTWVADARTRAQNGPIPNSNVDAVAGTPTVIVNGVKYTGALNDAKAFAAFVIQAENDDSATTSTSTPTPAPAETAAPAETPAP
ncbi:protein-disulfide isomerase [Conyzicola lurida]|uniref:Protein-disulfide isomerase n=1 Tax=Conyzicola lurida TaxID=1172621 RepID=A0A841AJU0_9MICO|nr:protein-disulfide isomerase [Conyzicola lurida]